MKEGRVQKHPPFSWVIPAQAGTYDKLQCAC